MSSKCAAYLYSHPDKDYDFDMMLDMLIHYYQGEEEIQEVYADGWDAVPNGLSELIADLSKYDKVVLLSMEGLTTSDLRTLVDGAHLYCCFAPIDIGWMESHKSAGFKKLCHILEGKPYWDSVRSMNIKAGMKKTDKHVGNIPFGHERTADGKLREIPEEMAIANQVKHGYLAGVSVMEISASSGLTPRQVYGLMEYWGVKRNANN